MEENPPFLLVTADGTGFFGKPFRNIRVTRKAIPVFFNDLMQIDAFNYNVWGMGAGRVRSISSDIFIQDGQPLFKVWCETDHPVLRLKNGYQGTIKKGMTVQARFLVTKRTLFQLLFDKADDWLNPNLIPYEH